MLGLLALGAQPAAALEVAVEIGLGGKQVASGWTALRVRCTLADDEPAFSGRVVVDRASQAVGAYATPLQLNPGEERVVRLAAPAGVAERWTVRVEDAAGRTVAQGNPKGVSAPVDPDPGLLVLLALEGLTPLTSEGDDHPLVARVAPADLPRDAGALAGVNAIVLPCREEPDPQLLELLRDAEAVDTLERYVREGGTLVVAGASHAWRGTELERLLPVALIEGGGAAEEPIPVAAFAAFLGDLPAGAPVPPVLRVEKHGSALPGIDPSLAMQGTRGRGRVVFLPFDLDHHAVRDATGFIPFVSDKLAPPRDDTFVGPSPDDLHDFAAEAFEARPPLGPVLFGVLVLVVVLQLLAMGPGASLAGKRRGPWGAFLVPPLTGVLLGLALLLVGLARRDDPRALAVITHVDAGRYFTTTTLDLGLVAGSDTQLLLTVPPGLRPTVQDRDDLELFHFRARRPALVFEGGRPTELGPFSVGMGELRHVQLSGSPGQQPSAAVGAPLPVRLREVPGTQTGDDMAWDTVEVTSRADAPLSGLYVVSIGVLESRFAALPDVAPGATFSWDPSKSAVLVSPASLQADPFAELDAVTRAALAQHLADGLESLAIRARVANHDGQLRDFPSAWLIHVTPAAAPQLDLHTTDGEAVTDVRAIRVSLIAAR
ncbi:hypothetical protein OAX78_01125 [Planctomycetota bacterium]|nr:hypothetical protein [Planctomycetota bacterium]